MPFFFCILLFLFPSIAMAQWTNDTETSPSIPARSHMPGAYDPYLDKWIIYGGRGDTMGTPAGETWIRDFAVTPRRWAQHSTGILSALYFEDGPCTGGGQVWSQLKDTAMVFVDTNSQHQTVRRFVICQGIGKVAGGPWGNIATCFSLDLAASTPAWTCMSQTGGTDKPLARMFHAMTYSPATGKLYLMGGDGQGPTGMWNCVSPVGNTTQGVDIFEGDVSASGSTIAWTRRRVSSTGVTPTCSLLFPILQWVPSSASSSGGFIFYGGGFHQGDNHRVWRWDAVPDTNGRALWTEVSPTPTPSSGLASSTAYGYNPATGLVTSYGGSSDNTWVFHPDDNTQVTRTYTGLARPSQRAGPTGIVRARSDQSVVPEFFVFGGVSSVPTLFNETWAYAITVPGRSNYGTWCSDSSAGGDPHIRADPWEFQPNLLGVNDCNIGVNQRLVSFVSNGGSPGAVGALLIGLSNPATSWGNGCYQWSSGETTLVWTLDANGRHVDTISMPNNPALVGSSLFYQAAILTSTSVLIWSEGLEVDIGF